MQILRSHLVNVLPYGLVSHLRTVAHEKRELNARKHFYSRFVKPGDLVFDVGANRGNRVAAFAALGASVHAFEPQPNCTRILQKQFGKCKNVTIHQIALGAKAGQQELFISSQDVLSTMSQDFIQATQRSGRFSQINWKDSIIVEVCTLDTLIANYGKPSFIKIDVEGYELSVISALTSAVPCLSLEWTPELHTMMQKCITHLISIGFDSFNISIGESMQMLETDLNPEQTLQTIDCLKGLKTVFGDIYAFSSRH